MALDYIREKAKQLGLDPGSSSNHEDNLRTIASQLGLDYDFTDLSEIESILDEMLILKQREDALNNLVDGIEELLEAPIVEEVTEEENQQNNNRSNRQQEESADDEETADEASDNDENKQNEEVVDNKESKDSSDSVDSSDKTETKDSKENLKGENEPTSKKGKDGDIPNKEEGVPETKGQKNWNDKQKATKETVQKNPNSLQNKFNNVQNKMQNLKNSGGNLKQGIGDAGKKLGGKALDAGKTAGKAVGDGAKAAGQAVGKAVSAGAQKLVTLIATHPEVAAIVIGIILVIFIIFLLFMAFSDTNDSESLGYYDSTCDFNQTSVTYTNCADGTTSTMDLEKFVKGVTYTLVKDQNFSNDQIQAMIVAVKTTALSNGNYSNSNKSIVVDGCTMEYQDYSSMNKELSEAYEEVKEELYLPSNYVDTIASLTSNTALEINSESFLTNAGSYINILNSIYSEENLQIYALKDNCTYYTIVEDDNDAFWWPIGSDDPTTGNIYGGTPATTYISSGYGWRELTNSFHKAIDIAGGSCVAGQGISNNVIIASRAGTVTAVKEGCPSQGYFGSTCNGGSGNYVKIDHGDGTETLYVHLMANSIVVKENDQVAQGQKIALMGSSGNSTGCHLHFEVRVNGARMNPLNYVDPKNPRPLSNDSNQQAVCRALKNKGLSDNAVSALMINIKAESGFNPNNIGDNGTSYGLCQWHNERWDRLKDYSPTGWKTVNGQVDYLMYELETGYASVYDKLKSTDTTSAMAEYFCLVFEKPANKETICPKRTNTYLATMTSYVNNNCS